MVRQLLLSIVGPEFRPAIPTSNVAVLVTVTLVVPFPLNDAGEDVDASRRTDPPVSALVIVQVAVTRVAGSPGASVTDVGESEHELTGAVTVVVREKVDGVDVSSLVLATSN
jgi:hypothetical protein